MVKPHEFISRGKPQLKQFQKGVDVLQHSDVYIAGERYGDENLCIFTSFLEPQNSHHWE